MEAEAMIRKSIVLIGLIAAAAGCAQRTTTADKTAKNIPGPAEEKVAEKRGDHVVSKISFKPGTTELTDAAKAELDNALNEARRAGAIDDVTVAVWSDVEYPANRDRKAPRAQVNLAEERGENIEDFIAGYDDISGWDVSIHNMSKRPNYLQDWLRTADARLKKQLVDRGVAKTDDTMNVTPGGASSALVFIKLR
jgi:hypothetical protein